MKVNLMSVFERQHWERYSRIMVRVGNSAGYLFIHKKRHDRWYFRGHRVEAQGFYEAMTKLEERIFGVEGLTDGELLERVGAMIGGSGVWVYLYESKLRQGVWVWCGHEFEAGTEKKVRILSFSQNIEQQGFMMVFPQFVERLHGLFLLPSA